MILEYKIMSTRSGSYNRYVDLRVNGRLFPTWVMANFKKFKLDPVERKEGEDPCKIKTKKELRAYQAFFGSYLDYKSPYRDVLIYHGLGSGKTVSAINVYNVLYNYTPGWNVYLLIKASLRNNPWMTDIEEWLKKEDKASRFENIIFVHYDSPTADKQFIEATKNADSSKKNMFIIDEAHNFIRNVYSNINSKTGRRAQIIYDYIIQDKTENEGTRVLLLSATPAINKPYELALTFNLLRPGIFSKSENDFNNMYISTGAYKTVNAEHKNMFQRRILGLVSYYIGATPDLYATKAINYVDVEMSKHQTEIYTHFEDVETAMERRKRKIGMGGETYKSYTRQSSNFVFPYLSQDVNGENRPRPSKFRISEREAQKVDEGKTDLKLEKGSDKYMNVNKYLKAMDIYISTFENYLDDQRKKNKQAGYTLQDDVKKYKDKYNGRFEDFHKNEKKKSNLYEAMYSSSGKMVNMIFNILKSKGPVLVYSNYVKMEGIQIFKLYLKQFGFYHFSDDTKQARGYAYAEYHGGIKDRDERERIRERFNMKENKLGDLVKIIMISPAGSEGISLRNVRQVHIMEPYWHEVRITQIIGRAIRQCSHVDLPMEDRHVEVFRYKSVRANGKWTADQQIDDIAKGKDNLIQSFLDTLKECAIDCALNKNHNMMNNEYKCFQFEEQSLFDKNIGPAYKKDIYNDMKIDNGLNSTTSRVVKVKVMKIKAVKLLSKEDEPVKYSNVQNYWFYDKSGTVYDEKLHYPVGKVAEDDAGIPVKKDKDTYIIDKVIPIPMISQY
jgi:superfamily II DNA or RNA helicase